MCTLQPPPQLHECVCCIRVQDGKDVKLSSYQGFLGKPVVLYFYPSDDSPGLSPLAIGGVERALPGLASVEQNRHSFRFHLATGCTKQANAFKSSISAFKKAGAIGEQSGCCCPCNF